MFPELLACPFCDSTATIHKMEDDGLYAVICDQCSASLGDNSFGDYHIGEGGNFGEFKTELEAADAWNTRGKC